MREKNQTIQTRDLVPGRETGEVRVGRIVAVDELGVPSIAFEGNPVAGPIAARSTQRLEAKSIGRSAVLVFESGRPEAPIVIGLLHDPLEELIEAPSEATAPHALEVDGESLVIEAKREVVLRCGDSSLTLRRDGRILIRGNEIVSRSSGANRVKGASVHLN